MNAPETPVAPGAPAPEPRASHQPPAGAGAMNVVRWALFGVLVFAAGASIAGYVVARRAAPVARAGSGPARYYCPMHPTYTADRPGQCPICGMNLEPIPQAASGAATGGGDVPGLTTVHLTPERIQMIGVRTAVAERRPFGPALELVGFVAPDESRLRQVQVRVAGWVEKLHVDATGQTVRAGQPLLTLYSPEVYESEQEYLIETSPAPASAGGDSAMSMPHDQEGSSAARRRLLLMGVPPAELERLAQERTASTRIMLPSPVTGTVLARDVSEGQSIGADTPLLTVADLSRVWVLADVHEMDLDRVHAGDAARFTSDALPGRSFAARIDFVYPTVSSATRTLEARLVLDNAAGLLRPGMYGRVRVASRGGEALTVPSEAVVRAGPRDYVFVARAGGAFEPREVAIGPGDGERVQVLRGIAAGDTVVASASFLIDSESRLQAAIAGMGAGPATGAHHHRDAP